MDARVEKFIITGFPRSRTAWLSNFFTYEDSFCNHDALKNVHTIQEWKELFNRQDIKYVGDSDSAIPLIMDEIDDILTTSKIVIVENQLERCLPSFIKEFSFGMKEAEKVLIQALSKTKDKLNELKEKYKYYSIELDDLDNMEKCKELWNYIVPDIIFPQERWELLNEMNITVNVQKHATQSMIAHTGWFLLEYI